jgi:hypothetical protein
MFTKKSSEFYARQQSFIFISPDAKINPATNLPDNKNDICVVDMDWCETNGCPPINDDGEDMEFWAVLEPGETLPNEVQ